MACHNCPLNGGTPIDPSIPSNPQGVLLGECPSKLDELTSTLFSGDAGELLEACCDDSNIDLSKLAKVSALGCRVSKPLRQQEWKTAVACCADRRNEALAPLQGLPVLAMGPQAHKLLTGKESLQAWCGYPLNTAQGPCLSVHAPTFVLRKPWIRPVFRIFFRRFGEMVLKTWQPEPWEPLAVEDPQARLQGLEALEQEMANSPIGIDVETIGTNALTAPLICVGVASPFRSVSVPTMDFPGMPEAKGRELRLLRHILAHAPLRVMHNNQFDTISLRAHGFDVSCEFDTIYAHAVVADSLPHDLGFVAVCELPRPRWKAEFRALLGEAGSERFVKADPTARGIYNAKDCLMTAKLYAPLFARLQRHHKGPELMEQLTKLGHIATAMKTRGVHCDRARLKKHQVSLKRRAFQSVAKMGPTVERLGFKGATERKLEGWFNPNRKVDLVEAFVTKLKHVPRKFTPSKQIKFDAEVLLTLGGSTNPAIAELARENSRYRKVKKLLSTYMDLDLTYDGRIHAGWNVHGARTGRWSCSEPNLMNIPESLRDIIAASPGKTLVKADYEAIELRIAALLAGARKLLEWFNAGVDVHAYNAMLLFGLSKPAIKGGPHANLRTLVKGGTYGLCYGASPDTLWENLVVDFPSLGKSDVLRFVSKFEKQHPEIGAFHRALVRSALERGYIEAPLSGRRHYTHGLFEPNKLYNYPIQDTAGAIINAAMLRIELQLEEEESILLQVHDELCLEGPNPKRLVDLLQAEMAKPVTLNGQTVAFPIEIKVGTHWNECRKP